MQKTLMSALLLTSASMGVLVRMYLARTYAAVQVDTRVRIVRLTSTSALLIALVKMELA